MELVVQFSNVKKSIINSKDGKTILTLPKNNESSVSKEIVDELTNSLKQGSQHHVQFCSI